MAVGYVAEDIDREPDAARPVPHWSGPHQREPLRPRPRPPPADQHFRRLLAEEGGSARQAVERERSSSLVQQLEVAHDLCSAGREQRFHRGEPEDFGNGGVGQEEPALRVLDGDALAHRVQGGTQLIGGQRSCSSKRRFSRAKAICAATVRATTSPSVEKACGLSA